MGIITFLKKRYKENLVKKLNSLHNLSKDYSTTIEAYRNSINSLCNSYNHTDISSFFKSYFNSSYYSEELTMNYDLYNYYTTLYNRVNCKIKKLEKRLQKL